MFLLVPFEFWQALITLKKGLQVLIWISSSGEKRLKLASVSKIVPRQRTVRRYSSFSCESVLFGSCSEASGLNTVSFKAVFYVVKLHPSFCFFCFFNFSALAKLSVTC